MFTKKHFQAFADVISQTEDANTAEQLARTCADIFESNNPSFDAERFYKACGVSATTTDHETAANEVHPAVQDIDRPDINGKAPTMQHIATDLQKALKGHSLDCLNVTGDDNLMSSVDVRGSFDKRDTWSNGIFHNSRFFIFSIVPANGKRYYRPETDKRVTVSLDSVSYKIARPFRKSTTTPEKAISRIVDWIKQANA